MESEDLCSFPEALSADDEAVLHDDAPTVEADSATSAVLSVVNGSSVVQFVRHPL